MSGKIIFYILAASLLVSSCAHNQHSFEKTSELFRTKISENDIKLFVYQLNVDLPDSRPSSYSPGGKACPPTHADERVDLLLTNILNENRFCRNGYIELDRYHLYNGSIQIRGKCEESASTADRKAFPNS